MFSHLVKKCTHNVFLHLTLGLLPSSLSCEKRWAPSGLIYFPSSLPDTLQWGRFFGGQCGAGGCKPRGPGSGSTWPTSRPSPSAFYRWASRHQWILCRSGLLTSCQRSAGMRHMLSVRVFISLLGIFTTWKHILLRFNIFNSSCRVVVYQLDLIINSVFLLILNWK